MKLIDGFPRRNRLDHNEPTELAIRAAINAVEGLGADVRLTEAVTLLGRALDKVADYVEDEAVQGTAPAKESER